MLTKKEYQRVIVALETGCEVTHEEADTSAEEMVITALMKIGGPYGDKSQLLEAYFTGGTMLNSIAEYIIRIENKTVKIEENA